MTASLELVEIACPLCGSNDHKFFLKTIDFAHGIGGEFTLVRCNDCGHVYLNPAPATESLAACYPEGYAQHRDQQAAGVNVAPDDGESEAHASEPQTSATPWYLSSPVRRIPGLRAAYYWLTDRKSQCLPPVDPSGRTALEIGCANGEFLQQLQNSGWKTQGLELVEGPANVARGRGFHVHLGPVESAAYDDRQFNDVFAWMVVEHLPDPVRSLMEINRIMQPGGWFCFSIPNFGSPERHIFRRYWRGYDLPRHLQHFTVRRILEVLKRAGFVPRKVIHQPSFLYWIGSAGLVFDKWCPWCPLGRTLDRWFWDNPPLWTNFILGPFARLQAALRLSGRVTVLAQKEFR